LKYRDCSKTIDDAPPPPWQKMSGTGNGVGTGLGDSAGEAAIRVGTAVACTALRDGEGDRAARDPGEAPTEQPLKHKIKRARLGSRPIQEG
jgi:hypothetical protein